MKSSIRSAKRCLNSVVRRQFSDDPRFIFKLSPEERIPHMKLLVCDMAGTTVNEGGLVYTTLQKVMNDAGLGVSDEEMINWHGAQKTEVVGHFVRDRLAKLSETESQKMADKIDVNFEVEIQDAYFAPESSVTLIHPELMDFCANLRLKGCKVALNTGYPKKIQNGLVEKLKLNECVDAWVSAGEVGLGRPYPYMVQLAMKRCEVMDAKLVAKAGDTARDIEEGLNAGCGLAIGVLSGASEAEGLWKAGADLVLPDITHFAKVGKLL